MRERIILIIIVLMGYLGFVTVLARYPVMVCLHSIFLFCYFFCLFFFTVPLSKHQDTNCYAQGSPYIQIFRMRKIG